MNLVLESWLINFQKPKQTNQSNVINLDFLLPLSPKTNQSYNTPDCCGSSFIGMVVKLESTHRNVEFKILGKKNELARC